MSAPAQMLSPPAIRPLAAWLRGTVATRVMNALALRRQRRHLARLEPHLLADIGLSRTEALAEAHRPMWDAPDHWLR